MLGGMPLVIQTVLDLKGLKKSEQASLMEEWSRRAALELRGQRQLLALRAGGPLAASP